MLGPLLKVVRLGATEIRSGAQAWRVEEAVGVLKGVFEMEKVEVTKLQTQRLLTTNQ